jgi:Haem-binding domain
MEPPEDAARMIYARELTPVNVQSTLNRPCNDCHSSRTVWPWYSHIAPVSWMLASHVNEGRADLNFSEWAAYVRTVRFATRSSICGTLDSAANRSRSPMRQNARKFPNSITLASEHRAHT